MGFGEQVQTLVDAFFTILLEILREQFGPVFDLIDLLVQITM